MNRLLIPEKNFLPEILLDKENSIFRIRGKSIPENAESFYSPVLKWIEDYFENPNNATELEIMLHYYNSSSARSISKIIKMFDDKYNEGLDVRITWVVLNEDEEMINNGEDFKILFKLPIEIKTI